MDYFNSLSDQTDAQSILSKDHLLDEIILGMNAFAMTKKFYIVGSFGEFLAYHIEKKSPWIYELSYETLEDLKKRVDHFAPQMQLERQAGYIKDKAI